MKRLILILVAVIALGGVATATYDEPPVVCVEQCDTPSTPVPSDTPTPTETPSPTPSPEVVGEPSPNPPFRAVEAAPLTLPEVGADGL